MDSGAEIQQGLNSQSRNGPKNKTMLMLVQQMYHVKEYPYSVPGNLDLQIADDEEFSPDKLRSNIERLYMTVVRILYSFVHRNTS